MKFGWRWLRLRRVASLLGTTEAVNSQCRCEICRAVAALVSHRDVTSHPTRKASKGRAAALPLEAFLVGWEVTSLWETRAATARQISHRHWEFTASVVPRSEATRLRRSHRHPNFILKFGRRKPCLRYIGPRTGTPGAPAGGGLCPAPSGAAGYSDDRVGADLCVRPLPPAGPKAPLWKGICHPQGGWEIIHRHLPAISQGPMRASDPTGVLLGTAITLPYPGRLRRSRGRRGLRSRSKTSCSPDHSPR